MSKQILHVMMAEKFMPSFIDVINNNFSRKRHKMVVINISDVGLPLNFKDKDLIWITRWHQLLKLSYLLNTSNKIILHGLFLNSLIATLFLQPWLLKKCYWVMWGGDFYFPENQRWFKKQVIKQIRHFITYIKGDFQLMKKWYGVKGKMYECFMYPSNLYKDLDVKQELERNTINIQVGNSADPTNNHLEVFEKLSKYKDEDIKIHTLLSYSDEDHLKKVIKAGNKIFGDKFMAHTDFMTFEKYLKFLSDIDVAIFAHKRQQAMGNIITLLGLGKKVYIRKDITTWKLFSKINVKLFDLNNLKLEKIDYATKKDNIEKIKSYFCETTYIKQLENIFD